MLPILVTLTQIKQLKDKGVSKPVHVSWMVRRQSNKKKQKVLFTFCWNKFVITFLEMFNFSMLH